MLLAMFQSVLNGLGALLATLVSLLPASPFDGIYSLTIDNELLQGLAWLIPFPQIVAVLDAWISAVAIFYLYKVVLKWIGAVSG